MGINLNIYSTNKLPIQINELASQCESRGWTIIVVRNRQRFTSIKRGTIRSGDMVFGWLEEKGESRKLELAVSDKVRLKMLWEQNVLGGLEV